MSRSKRNKNRYWEGQVGRRDYRPGWKSYRASSEDIDAVANEIFGTLYYRYEEEEPCPTLSE